MKFKVMNYNILNGICNEEKPFILDEKRLAKIVKILQKEDPDILVLTEAYFWPFAKKDNLENYSNLFNNFCKLYAPAQNQFRWAPVVFSRFPIEFTDFSEYHKTFLRTSIQIGKNKLFLDVVHPYPELVEKEKTELITKVLESHKEPYILTGDFNSLSPDDNYNPEKLLEGYRKFMKDKAGFKIKDMLQCQMIKIVLTNGLIDTYKSKHEKFDYTVPTNLRSSNKESAARMDYIFCSRNFKVVESGIIKNKFTEDASDHYPVYAVLEI
ncbi:MAG: endonuclease/exonuclease/phosphatase family protein [Nanoarchaeota archaeon]